MHLGRTYQVLMPLLVNIDLIFGDLLEDVGIANLQNVRERSSTTSMHTKWSASSRKYENKTLKTVSDVKFLLSRCNRLETYSCDAFLL